MVVFTIALFFYLKFSSQFKVGFLFFKKQLKLKINHDLNRIQSVADALILIKHVSTE